MKYSFIPLLILLFLFMGCEKENDNTFKLNDPFSLECREKLHNSMHNLSIRFDSLLEDSRCPEEMVCTWEGNASAAFTIIYFDRIENFSLDTYQGRNYHNDTALLGFTIKLNALYRNPEFIAPHYADSSLLAIIPYIAELEISK